MLDLQYQARLLAAAKEAMSKVWSSNPASIKLRAEMISSIGALAHERPYRRATAAQNVGALKCAEAVDTLILMLGDKDSSVRSASAEALGQIGDPRSVEHLIQAMESADSTLKTSVAAALRIITGKKFLIGSKDPKKWREWWGEYKSTLGEGRKPT